MSKTEAGLAHSAVPGPPERNRSLILLAAGAGLALAAVAAYSSWHDDTGVRKPAQTTVPVATAGEPVEQRSATPGATASVADAVPSATASVEPAAKSPAPLPAAPATLPRPAPVAAPVPADDDDFGGRK